MSVIVRLTTHKSALEPMGHIFAFGVNVEAILPDEHHHHMGWFFGDGWSAEDGVYHNVNLDVAARRVNARLKTRMVFEKGDRASGRHIVNVYSPRADPSVVDDDIMQAVVDELGGLTVFVARKAAKAQ